MQKGNFFLENRVSAKGSLWKQRTSNIENIGLLKNDNDIPELIAKILAGRKIFSEEANDFLYPEVNKLLKDPSCLFDMDNGINCLISSIKNNETIGILGDYDVDGATSSSILKLFFDHYNIRSEIYIPDRLKEGYGPNKNAINTFYDKGVKTFITVDCGATSVNVMDFANQKGMKAIIIDHHKVDEQLPKCIAHINPSREEDSSLLNDLAAVGLTFIFIVALRRAIRNLNLFPDINEPGLKQYLDLVALGTVCDVVQLSLIHI